MKDISPGRLDLGVGELAVGVSQTSPKIQRVLIILHGRLRNAETYRQSVEKAAAQAGQSASTLVIAPQFLNESDITRHQLADSVLRWRGNEWMAGDLSTGPQALSAYAVLDRLLTRLSNRREYPTLKEVVIAGHSGGGQVVQRFALLGDDQPALRQAGVKVRYVIANPSSYTYFDRQRRVSVDRKKCPDFNDWKDGLDKLPAYAKGQTVQSLEQRYIERDITYLLGQLDTNAIQPALDKTCAALAQGPSRQERGLNCFNYLTQRHPQGLKQHLVQVPGVGHNGDKMFTSPQGQQALFRW
ncbi:alpha/beta hydrolase [Pseudomonas sp. RA_35y_Pfl2_P32]|uniref:alpha/beta hydrolase n=1 Tax=Pseudomonas sp. RA_35y_Pfl2_P32 TaxID=3088705 RepID=UPI0030DB6925